MFGSPPKKIPAWRAVQASQCGNFESRYVRIPTPALPGSGSRDQTAIRLISAGLRQHPLDCGDILARKQELVKRGSGHCPTEKDAPADAPFRKQYYCSSPKSARYAAASLSGQRQLSAATRARDAVSGALDAAQGLGLDAVSVCVDDALDALCELTGENASEAVINEVFEKFCVGK